MVIIPYIGGKDRSAQKLQTRRMRGHVRSRSVGVPGLGVPARMVGGDSLCEVNRLLFPA